MLNNEFLAFGSPLIRQMTDNRQAIPELGLAPWTHTRVVNVRTDRVANAMLRSLVGHQSLLRRETNREGASMTRICVKSALGVFMSTVKNGL